MMLDISLSSLNLSSQFFDSNVLEVFRRPELCQMASRLNFHKFDSYLCPIPEPVPEPLTYWDYWILIFQILPPVWWVLWTYVMTQIACLCEYKHIINLDYLNYFSIYPSFSIICLIVPNISKIVLSIVLYLIDYEYLIPLLIIDLLLDCIPLSYRAHQFEQGAKLYAPLFLFPWPSMVFGVLRLYDGWNPSLPLSFTVPPAPTTVNGHRSAAHKRKTANAYIDGVLSHAGRTRFDVAAPDADTNGVRDLYFSTDTKDLPVAPVINPLIAIGLTQYVEAESLVFIDVWHHLSPIQKNYWMSYFVPTFIYIDCPLLNVGTDSEGTWCHGINDSGELFLKRTYVNGDTYLDIQYDWFSCSFLTWTFKGRSYSYRKHVVRCDDSHIIVCLIPAMSWTFGYPIVRDYSPLVALTGVQGAPIVRILHGGNSHARVSINLGFRMQTMTQDQWNIISASKNARTQKSVSAALSGKKRLLTRAEQDDRPVDQEVQDPTSVDTIEYQNLCNFSPEEIREGNTYTIGYLQLMSIWPFGPKVIPEKPSPETQEITTFSYYGLSRFYDADHYAPRANVHFGATLIHPMFCPAKTPESQVWAHTGRYLKCMRILKPKQVAAFLKYRREFARHIKNACTLELAKPLHDSVTTAKHLVQLEYTLDFDPTAKCNIFAKDELYTEPKEFRVISNVDAKTNLRMLPYALVLQKALAEHDSTKWFMIGRDEYSFPLDAVDVDVSRNDGSHNLLHRSLEVVIFEECFGSAVASFVSREIFIPFQIGFEKERFIVPAFGSRKSGSQLTSLMNTLVHAYLQYVFAREFYGYPPDAALKYICPGYGDDQKVRRHDVKAYTDFALALGFKITLEPSGLLGCSKFLGRLWSEEAWTWDPQRVVPKMGIAISNEHRTQAFLNKWAGYYLGDDKPIAPILGVLAAFAHGRETEDVTLHHFTSSKIMPRESMEEIWDQFDPDWRELEENLKMVVDDPLSNDTERVNNILTMLETHYGENSSHFESITQKGSIVSVDASEVPIFTKGTLEVKDITTAIEQYFKYKDLHCYDTVPKTPDENEFDLLTAYIERFGSNFGVYCNFGVIRSKFIEGKYSPDPASRAIKTPRTFNSPTPSSSSANSQNASKIKTKSLVKPRSKLPTSSGKLQRGTPSEKQDQSGSGESTGGHSRNTSKRTKRSPKASGQTKVKPKRVKFSPDGAQPVRGGQTKPL
jgi:hypothetical protein